ncbi:hypothetical protein HYS47_04190 [Candidatus Woesearchaeota archaeon]|nr:hypothetical protein [Candidatus Woesearchaeota archaeon]
MVSKLEKVILQELKASVREQRRLSDSIYLHLANVRDCPVSKRFQGALEYLLLVLNPNDLQREGVLLGGSISRNLQPSQRGEYAVYRVTISGGDETCFVLPESKVPRRARAEVTIHPRHAEVTLYHGQQLIKKKEVQPYGKFFTYHLLPESIIASTQGVQILPLPKNRRVAFGKQRFTIPEQDQCSLVILVHDRGKLFLYDIRGRPLLPSPTIGEMNKETKNNKARGLEEKLGSLELDDAREEACEYLLHRWRTSPRDFRRYGLTLLFRGNIKGRLDRQGRFSFEASYGDDKRNVIYVSADYAQKIVTATFHGRIVCFYVKDELLNAYEAEGWFTCRRIHHATPSVETMRVRDISSDQDATIYERGRKYYFSRATLQRCEEEAGGVHQALFIHHVGDDTSFKWIAHVKNTTAEYEIRPDSIK